MIVLPVNHAQGPLISRSIDKGSMIRPLSGHPDYPSASTARLP